MLARHKKFSIATFLLAGISLLQSSPAFADYHGWNHHSRHDDWGRHSRQYHSHYPVFGRAVVNLPGGFINIVFGGRRYYYCDGIFYNRGYRDYVVVRPPRGAIISYLPEYRDRVVVNGTIYYVSNDVYYSPVRNGYQVVEAPGTSVQSINNAAPNTIVNQSVQNEPINDSNSESITVNVPNNQGGYTAVVIRKTGDGFVGPQGEYYPEFPRVEQLKVMYAQNKD
jgi:hypothetical protein